VGTPVTGSTDTSYSRVDSYPDGAPSNSLTGDANVGGNDGAMELIWDVVDVGMNWLTQVHDGTSYLFTNFKAWMSTPSTGTGNFNNPAKTELKDLLDYFYKTTKAGVDGGVVHYSNHADLAAIEASPTSFYIDTKSDLVPDNPSAADLYHVFLPSGYVHGWKRALQVTQLGALDGTNVIWNEDLLPAASLWHDDRARYFYVDRTSGVANMTKDWADLPALVWSASALSPWANVNISGALYTPAAINLTQGASTVRQYISGITVLGFGGFFDGGNAGKTVISYDDAALDKLPTTKPHNATRRFYWEELR